LKIVIKVFGGNLVPLQRMMGNVFLQHKH